MNAIRTFIAYALIGYMLIGFSSAGILHFVFYEGDSSLFADPGYVNTLVGLVLVWPVMLMMLVIIVLAAAFNSGCC